MPRPAPRARMRALPILVAALLLAPLAAASTTTLLVAKHQWTGLGAGPDLRQFVVPDGVPVVCYVRWASGPAAALTTYDGTLLDGVAFPVVVDTWSRAATSGQGFQTNVAPILLSGGAFAPGVFTFSAMTGGVSGDVRIHVYAASSPAECGTLPPP